MILQHYQAIKQLIEQIPDIRKVEFYNEQYQHYEQLNANEFPIAYVEFQQPIQWETAGEGLQISRNAVINVHLVDFDIKNDITGLLQLATELHKKLHLAKLMNAQEQLTTALMRTASEIKQYDQIKTVILTYETALYDRSAMPNFTEVTVMPKIEKT